MNLCLLFAVAMFTQPLVGQNTRTINAFGFEWDSLAHPDLDRNVWNAEGAKSILGGKSIALDLMQSGRLKAVDASRVCMTRGRHQIIVEGALHQIDPAFVFAFWLKHPSRQELDIEWTLWRDQHNPRALTFTRHRPNRPKTTETFGTVAFAKYRFILEDFDHRSSAQVDGWNLATKSWQHCGSMEAEALPAGSLVHMSYWIAGGEPVYPEGSLRGPTRIDISDYTFTPARS